MNSQITDITTTTMIITKLPSTYMIHLNQDGGLPSQWINIGNIEKVIEREDNVLEVHMTSARKTFLAGKQARQLLDEMRSLSIKQGEDPED